MVVHYHLQWYVWCMQELLMLWLHTAIFESYGNHGVWLDNFLFCQWYTCSEMICPLSCGVAYSRVCVHFMFLRHYYTLLLICALIILCASCSGIVQLFRAEHFLHACNKVLVVLTHYFCGFSQFQADKHLCGLLPYIQDWWLDYVWNLRRKGIVLAFSWRWWNVCIVIR